MLKNEGIPLDGALLFGSRAKNSHHAESDIDLAIVSRDFGIDRFTESVLLNRLVFRCLKNCEAVPIGLKDYLNPQQISPLLYEIKSTGTPLL